jgi:hypothetical protein
MKKILFLSLLMLGLVFGTTPARADDILVVDVDLPNTFSYGGWGPFSPDTNPMAFSPDNEMLEGAWLKALLGGVTQPFISKYVGNTSPYGVPANWTYAVLKFGVGPPAPTNPDHWAIQDDGDFILELGDIWLTGTPLPGGLSHVSYF